VVHLKRRAIEEECEENADAGVIPLDGMTGPTALTTYRMEALRSQRFDIELRKKLLDTITQIVLAFSCSAWHFRATTSFSRKALCE
jgi:hypothetical protein